MTTPLGSSSRKPASVTFWVASEIGHHARAERDEGGIGRRRRRTRRRPRRQHALRWRVPASARSADTGRPMASGAAGGILCAERDGRRNCGLDLAFEHGGQRRALRDQLGLGLLDQLVLVDLQEIQAEQRQRQHARQHQKNHEAEAWPPLPRRVDARSGGVAQRDASQRPSLKPTPWTVSITESQPAAAILARMFLTWLSMVRSATWILPA